MKEQEREKHMRKLVMPEEMNFYLENWDGVTNRLYILNFAQILIVTI